eukprot:4195053-Pyramimonas_sp.AAC.1
MQEGPDKEQLKIAKTKEFEEMCKAPGIEKEGEWPNTRIWVFVKKQRIGDVERYIDTSFEEGSKQMKDMTKEDKDQLKQYTLTSTPSSSNAFLAGTLGKGTGGWGDDGDRDSAAQKAKPSDEQQEGPPQKRLKHVDVANVAPKLTEKLTIKVDKAERSATAQMALMEQALRDATPFGNTDQSMTNYKQTVTVRMHALRLWMGPTVVDAQQPPTPVALQTPVKQQTSAEQLEPTEGTKDEQDDNQQNNDDDKKDASSQKAVEGTPEAAATASPKEELAPPGGGGELSSASVGPATPTTDTKKAAPQSVKSAGSTSVVQKQSRTLRTYLADQGVRGQVCNDISKLISLPELRHHVERIPSAVSSDELTAIEEAINVGCEYFTQFITSLRQSTGSLTGHIRNQKSKADRDERKKALDEANKQIKASKEETKRLQEKLKATAKMAPPLFKLQSEELLSHNLIMN